jgi:C-terminal processing protease CtpA/Prc
MSAFCSETFARIRREDTRALIVDVRDNGGGNSGVSDVLFPYLTAQPYAQFGAFEMRISDRLKREYGREKFSAIYNFGGWTAPDGSILRYPGGRLTTPRREPLRFAGPIYVLLGTNTFSSAMNFATAVKDFRIATLVGQETGEPVVSTGEIYRTAAPNSGCGAFFSTKLFFGPKPHPEGQGVVPDIVVPTTLGDRIAGRDPVMEKALALID